MTARVVGLHVWPAGVEVPQAVDELVLDWGGPVGDRHHGETMLSDTRQRLLPQSADVPAPPAMRAAKRRR